ncbi:hypothetical protein NPIL_287071 [Nephila pilipes]|uniref:SOCS box domain-containing protein n=1 Tax=Nephila pilipes TaxID=299642 RepID=A0A8X6TTZ1_NEPPI|nr:hypothetical protein NPIL_287071 [Nephila pilipes]
MPQKQFAFGEHANDQHPVDNLDVNLCTLREEEGRYLNTTQKEKLVAVLKKDEMIGSLWRFSRNNIFMNKRTEMIFDNVNLIHPEITVPDPRSLQHLCRCSLRQRLADNHQLPEGTQNIGLPTVLKEYIDLET